MSKKYKTIKIETKTYDMIRKECIDVFLEQNPGCKGMHITNDFIINRMALVYLDQL